MMSRQGYEKFFSKGKRLLDQTFFFFFSRKRKRNKKKSRLWKKLRSLIKGIKDTSRSGTYHNKKFKQAAEAHGLNIELADKIGWSVTTATPQTKKWIEDNIPIKAFEIYKKTAADDKDGGKAKAKQSMVKKVCPLCGNIARVTSEFKLIYGECSKEMKADF